MTEQTIDPHGLNLYQKLAAISGEIGLIKKTGRNNEQKFDFIEYAAVAGQLRTLFAKYGVVVIPYMKSATKQTRTPITSKWGAQGEHILVDFTFVVRNADKPDEKFSVTWTGEATDYGDKATNKAATSALKYYLMRQFNVSEQGEDPDADSPGSPPKPADKPAAPKEPAQAIATKAQVTQIQLYLRGQGIEAEAMGTVLADKYGVKDPKRITQADATRVIDLLRAQSSKEGKQEQEQIA